MRVLVGHWPDWPVVAAGFPPDVPAAVVAANHVRAVTPAARVEGVKVGLRRREAQRRCPEMVLAGMDAGRDARAWEPLVAAVEEMAPGVAVVCAGELCLPTRGPSRYFGGDLALARRVMEVMQEAAGRSGCVVGVADGRFTAGLAGRAAALARAAGTGGCMVVEPGGSRAWLAPQPVRALGPDLAHLADLLVRLGIRTLGELADLPEPAVLGRFGPEGVEAQRRARGDDGDPVRGRLPPPDLACSVELDPPEERAEAAAFAAKSLADRLHAVLDSAGLVCTQVLIEAETEHGEKLARRWRHEGSLDASALSERTRWQLDGWLSGSSAGRPTGGLTLLRLVPEEVRPDTGRQLDFWGGLADGDERAGRAMARVQGLLGPEAVVTAVLRGGRSVADRVRLVPWGDALPSPETPAPWPGRLGAPSPVLVHLPPRPADLCDAQGREVEVGGRGSLSAAPAALAVGGGPLRPVVGWAGPWPIEERWWEGGGRRRARLQVVLDGGEAHLIYREGRSWWVEASYG